MTEYRSRTYLNRVLAASTATHSAAHVLRVMCWRAEFDRPEVTITKPQIQEMTGYHLKTIREALSLLKCSGSIEAIHNSLGGRSNAPTYRLLVAHKGEHKVRKGELNVRKGEHNEPPTIDSINSMSDGPASRNLERPAAGRGGRGIKRGAGEGWKRPQTGRIAEEQQSRLTPEEEKEIVGWSQIEIRDYCEAIHSSGDHEKARRAWSVWKEANDAEGI